MWLQLRRWLITVLLANMLLVLPALAEVSGEPEPVDYWQQPLSAAWQQYRAKSMQLLQQDEAALQQELRGGKPLPAPVHKYFGISSIDDEATAEAVLSYQTPSGGWSKRTDMQQPRAAGQHYGSEPDYVPTFDNDASSMQLHWLADYYPKARPAMQPRIQAAIERGVALILAAQYPSGGFPQSYPLRGGYHDAVTLNDDVMYQLMQLLWQIAHQPRFSMLADSTKADAAAAFYRAVDWLLEHQVVVNGKRTLWGAQHHPLSGEPVAARKFEQVALVSSESAKLLQLMLQHAPEYPGAAQSLADAALWLTAHQIENKDRHRDSDGRLSLVDSPGNRIWARFYDINTGEAVFFDRDGNTYNDVSQLSLERQRGYGWYQSVADEFLQRYSRSAKSSE